VLSDFLEDRMINKIEKLIKILREDPRPLRRLLGMVLIRLPFDIGSVVFIKIRIRDYFIRFHASALSLAFWHNPHDRSSDYNFMTSYLKPGDTYVDVGANIGTTLIPAAKSVADGHVMGFEPHPKVFSYLEENVLLNDLKENVKLKNCALGNKRGHATLSDKREDDINRVNSAGEGIAVPLSLLDDFTEDLVKVNLLKIDVEGYERFVVEGSKKTLKKTDCVYFEISEEHFSKFGYSVKDLLLMLEAAGFSLFVKAGAESIRPIDSDYRLDRDRTNAFAIKQAGAFIKRTGWGIRR
jgi:FkbM family methyltransferase